jgi:hypothetical protein
MANDDQPNSNTFTSIKGTPLSTALLYPKDCETMSPVPLGSDRSEGNDKMQARSKHPLGCSLAGLRPMTLAAEVDERLSDAILTHPNNHT